MALLEKRKAAAGGRGAVLPLNETARYPIFPEVHRGGRNVALASAVIRDNFTPSARPFARVDLGPWPYPRGENAPPRSPAPFEGFNAATQAGRLRVRTVLIVARGGRLGRGSMGFNEEIVARGRPAASDIPLISAVGA